MILGYWFLLFFSCPYLDNDGLILIIQVYYIDFYIQEGYENHNQIN